MVKDGWQGRGGGGSQGGCYPAWNYKDINQGLYHVLMLSFLTASPSLYSQVTTLYGLHQVLLQVWI